VPPDRGSSKIDQARSDVSVGQRVKEARDKEPREKGTTERQAKAKERERERDAQGQDAKKKLETWTTDDWICASYAAHNDR
jgi:hypothetical protein